MNNKPKKPSPSIKQNLGKHQDPVGRRGNFDEVAMGFGPEEAVAEAARCLGCKNKPCELACPVSVKVPEFVDLVYKEDTGAAASKIFETSLFPAICGRVCPQEAYCEAACVLKDKFGPVSIGRLERFTADYARKNGLITPPACAPDTGKKVACVGSGPTSLSVAAELRKLGHAVTVFEALHEFGGVLSYGIPTFRLPREVVRFEVDMLRKMGVRFLKNVMVGKSLTIDELKKDFDVVYIGSGAGLPPPCDILLKKTRSARRQPCTLIPTTGFIWTPALPY